MQTKKGQPVVLRTGRNQNQQQKRSTLHFGRVGYGKYCAASKFSLKPDDVPRPRFDRVVGFTSLKETFLLGFLLWFFCSVL